MTYVLAVWAKFDETLTVFPWPTFSSYEEGLQWIDHHDLEAKWPESLWTVRSPWP